MPMNPWSFLTPPTTNHFNMHQVSEVTSQTQWSMPPLIPRSIHLPVFSVSHTEVRHHHQTTNLDSPPQKRWKFKLQMSLSFRVRLSLPRAFQKWKSRMKPPPLDPIIPVTPNYELMKMLTTSPTPEDRPPSYHLPRYMPPCCTTCPM